MRKEELGGKARGLGTGGESRGWVRLLTVSILFHCNTHDPLVEFNVAIVFCEVKHFTVCRLELHAPVFGVGVHGDVRV